MTLEQFFQKGINFEIPDADISAWVRTKYNIS